jgi:hypothetical protein
MLASPLRVHRLAHTQRA